MTEIFLATTRNDAEAHFKAWRTACDCAGASLYFTPEWVLSLWDSHFRGREVEFYFCYEGDKLFAVFPFVRRRLWKAIAPLSHVALLTNVYGQNHNQLICFGAAHEGVKTLCSILARCPWDVLEITSMPSDASELAALASVSASECAELHLDKGASSPYLVLDKTWDEYLASSSSNFRSDMRRKWSKCVAAGVQVEEVRGPAGVEEAIEVILEIEARSWKQRVGTSIPVQESAVRFYKLFLPKAAHAGWLRIFVARAQSGTAVAYDMGIQLNGKYYMLKTGFDEEYAAISPGTFLRQFVIKQLISDGVREHDFLGDADSYKLRWTSLTREHSHVYLWNRSRLRSKAYLLAKAIGQRVLRFSPSHSKSEEAGQLGGSR